MEPVSLLIYALVALIVLAIVWYASGILDLPIMVRNVILLVALLAILLWLMQRMALI